MGGCRSLDLANLRTTQNHQTVSARMDLAVITRERSFSIAWQAAVAHTPPSHHYVLRSTFYPACTYNQQEPHRHAAKPLTPHGLFDLRPGSHVPPHSCSFWGIPITKKIVLMAVSLAPLLRTGPLAINQSYARRSLKRWLVPRKLGTVRGVRWETHVSNRELIVFVFGWYHPARLPVET